LAGRRVGVEPRARVIHDYAFERGARKWYLLERNRWRTLLAVYPPSLLLALAPALAAAELGILVLAARDHWLSAKLRAQLATLLGLRRSLARRRGAQAMRTISAAEFAQQLRGEIEHPNISLPRPVLIASAAYWRLTSLLLR
ncbi:MAG: hypothetical protein ABSD82_14430, partial [Solirubrobacteraceae bacterium]